MPLPIVEATVVPNIRKAIKLKNAAQMTACLGDKTLVETMVEMELAASCMPLVKSKTRAMTMMKIINSKLKVTIYYSSKKYISLNSGSKKHTTE